MARKPKEANRVDELLDELLAEDHSPEAVLGENGLLKQLSKRLVERALAGELNHHLQSESRSGAASNSRNGHSKKTIQSQHGPLDLQIPRDRNGSFEPILVPKHQRRLAGLGGRARIVERTGPRHTPAQFAEHARKGMGTAHGRYPRHAGAGRTDLCRLRRRAQ